MAETITIRLADLLGTDPTCEVITLRELEAIAEGRLSAARRAEIERHAGLCSCCEELLADLEQFLRVCEPGVRSARSSFRAADAQARAALGLPARRKSLAPRFPLAAAAAALIAVAGLAILSPDTRFAVNLSDAQLVAPPITRSAGPRAAIERARLAVAAHDLQQAQALIDEALASRPGESFLLHNQGVVRLRRGDPAGAVESLRASELAQGAASGETRFWLGVALARAGEKQAACAKMAEVSRMQDPRSKQARQIVNLACPQDQSAPEDQSAP